jgi:hypothetical protein
MGRGSVVGIVLGAALVGCGLDFVVSIEPEPAPSATTTSTSRPPPPPPPRDAEADAAPPIDAAEAGPDPADVTVSYVLASGRVYSFTVPGYTFVPLTSTGCPSSGEVAVFDDGTVYVAGDFTLTKWTPDVGCTEVARSTVQLPASLATATVAGKEELVGYVGMQFVTIDRVTAARTVITSDALASVGFPGDLTRVGRRLFVAINAYGAKCLGVGDCVVEVGPDGRPLVPPAKQASGPFTGLSHSGGKLLAFGSDKVIAIDPTTLAVGTAVASEPFLSYPSGAAAPAFPIRR